MGSSRLLLQFHRVPVLGQFVSSLFCRVAHKPLFNCSARPKIWRYLLLFRPFQARRWKAVSRSNVLKDICCVVAFNSCFTFYGRCFGLHLLSELQIIEVLLRYGVLNTGVRFAALCQAGADIHGKLYPEVVTFSSQAHLYSSDGLLGRCESYEYHIFKDRNVLQTVYSTKLKFSPLDSFRVGVVHSALNHLKWSSANFVIPLLQKMNPSKFSVRSLVFHSTAVENYSPSHGLDSHFYRLHSSNARVIDIRSRNVKLLK